MESGFHLPRLYMTRHFYVADIAASLSMLYFSLWFQSQGNPLWHVGSEESKNRHGTGGEDSLRDR